MMPQAILFDLDGTLLDTAQDITHAVNQVRLQHALPAISLAHLRPMIGRGVRALLKEGLGVDESHPELTTLITECLSRYHRQSTENTALFPGMAEVLDHLDALSIPWGIVTNKTTDLTLHVLKYLKLDNRAQCVVCADTLNKQKPDPAPVLYALAQLQCDPKHALFVGDARIDIEAGKSAGTQTIVALYGYIDERDDPLTWQADGYIKEPKEIMQYVNASQK